MVLGAMWNGPAWSVLFQHTSELVSQLGDPWLGSDSRRRPSQSKRSKVAASARVFWWKLQHVCRRCRSVTLPPLCCLFVDFSEQFVPTGKCHATLSALTPTPSATHCLSSPSSLYFSSATHRELPPSRLLTSPHVLIFPSHLLRSLSPEPWDSVVQPVSRNTVFHVVHSECACVRVWSAQRLTRPRAAGRDCGRTRGGKMPDDFPFFTASRILRDKRRQRLMMSTSSL